MKLIYLKYLPIFSAVISFIIGVFAHNDIIKNGGYTQAELGVFFSIIPFSVAIFLLLLYYFSNHVYNSIKFQILSAIVSIIIFAPIFVLFLSILFF